MTNTCPFIDFGMSCWFCVVTLELYLLSEDSTTALYLHFMSIQGSIMPLVTLRNLSPYYVICHTLSALPSLTLPSPSVPATHLEKKVNLSSQICYKCVPMPANRALLAHIIRKFLRLCNKLWIQDFSQTLSSVRETIFRSRWVFSINSINDYMWTVTVLILYLCIDHLSELP